LIAGLSAEPSGPLTVALPMAFSREIVAPRLNRFHSAFPGIRLEILVTSHPVDIIRDQIDIAVVVGPLENTELVAKTRYRGRLLPVASPDYAARLPEAGTIEDLVAHIHICESRYAIPRLEVLIDGQPTHINLAKIPIRVNDPVAVREAVVNGCGVSLLPNQYCRSAINAGKPVEVFGRVHFDAMASTLSAIYPGRRLLSNKTRAFLNFLEDICAEID
jgi:DNA-binding transcriptional LysR family regulator